MIDFLSLFSPLLFLPVSVPRPHPAVDPARSGVTMIYLLSAFLSEQMSKLDQKDPAESSRLPFQLLDEIGANRNQG